MASFFLGGGQARLTIASRLAAFVHPESTGGVLLELCQGKGSS
jgi:hypothetical protein